MAPKNDRELKSELKKVGICVRKRDGEYRVAKCGRGQRNEATAYYTDDRSDAFYTGQAMSAESQIRAGQSQQRALIHDDERGISGLGSPNAVHEQYVTNEALDSVRWSQDANDNAFKGKCLRALDDFGLAAERLGRVRAHIHAGNREHYSHQSAPHRSEADARYALGLAREGVKRNCLQQDKLSGIFGNISLAPGARVTYSKGAGQSASGKVTYAGTDVVMVKRDGGGTDTIFYSQIQQVLSSGKKFSDYTYPTREG